MTNINETRFSGTIKRLQQVQTKKGTSMARWLLSVGRDKFKCIAFKNVADAVLRCNDGDRITLAGKGSINSWKDDEGHWHNDFQVTAWTVEIDGQEINYQKAEAVQQVKQQPATRSPDPHGLSQYDYPGGPF